MFKKRIAVKLLMMGRDGWKILSSLTESNSLYNRSVKS